MSKLLRQNWLISLLLKQTWCIHEVVNMYNKASFVVTSEDNIDYRNNSHTTIFYMLNKLLFNWYSILV